MTKTDGAGIESRLLFFFLGARGLIATVRLRKAESFNTIGVTFALFIRTALKVSLQNTCLIKLSQ